MKKMILKVLLPVTLITAATSAFAAANGFYVQGDLGWTYANYKNSTFPYMASSDIRRNGLGGGAHFGYQLNPNFAAELGYTIYRSVTIDNILLNPNPTGSTSLQNGDVTLNTWDLAAKVMLPLNYGFGVNAKAGIARVKATVGGGLNYPALASAYQTQTRWTPELGAGASYDVNNNVGLGINLLHTFQSGSVPSLDSAMAAISYHFG